MKIYVAGKITGLDNFEEKFEAACNELEGKGFKAMNPAILPGGFEQDDYMHICYAMIDICEYVYFLNNWTDSKGAKLEHVYAIKNNKKIIYQQSEEKYDKEQIHDEQINPLMNQIIKICKENDIQMLCSFMLKEDGHIACTSYNSSQQYTNINLINARNII